MQERKKTEKVKHYIFLISTKEERKQKRKNYRKIQKERMTQNNQKKGKGKMTEKVKKYKKDRNLKKKGRKKKEQLCELDSNEYTKQTDSVSRQLVWHCIKAKSNVSN